VRGHISNPWEMRVFGSLIRDAAWREMAVFRSCTVLEERTRSLSPVGTLDGYGTSGDPSPID